MADKSLKIALLLSATDKASAVMGKAFTQAERQAKRLQKVSEGFDKVGNKALVAGGIITGMLTKTVLDAEKADSANKRLEQVFRSMGETTGKAAKNVEAYASSLQFKIAVDEDDIKNTAAKLSTFKSLISKSAMDAGLYNRALAATFDMQATGFGDSAMNAVQLGKALEDPIRGISAMARSGITFNDVEKKKIALLVQSGQKLKAQEIILKAVESQVGGVAEATADSSAKIKIGFTAASKAIGTALLPMVEKLSNWVQVVVPKIMAWAKENEGLIIKIAKAGAALLAFGVAMKVIAFAITAVSTAIKVFGYLARAIQFVGTVVSFVGRLMLANPIVLIITAVAVAALLIWKYWEPIKAFFIRLWDNVKRIFSATWQWIKSMFLNYTPAGLIIKHWSKIIGFFSGLWEKVKATFSEKWQAIKNIVTGVFNGVFDYLGGLAGRFFDAGKNIVLSITSGIKTMAMKPVNAIKEMVGKIRDHLPFSPAKIGPLKDIHRIKLVETIASSINSKPLLKSFANVTGQLYQQMNRPAPIPAFGGGSQSIQFAPVINLSGSATQADGDMITSKLKSEFSRMMREYNAQKTRTSF